MIEKYTIGLVIHRSGFSDYQFRCLVEVLREHRKAVRHLKIKVPGFHTKNERAGLPEELIAELTKRCHEIELGKIPEGTQTKRVLDFLRDCDEVYGFPSFARSKVKPDRVWSAYNSAVQASSQQPNFPAGWMKIIQPWYSTSTGCAVNH